VEQDKNLTGLINSITENVTTLVRGHIELAKAEVVAAIKNAVKSSVLFLIALAMVNLGMIFLFIGLAFWISQAFDLASSKVKKIVESRKTIDSINATSQTLQSLIPGKK
jgi:uncharacterized membrane protein YqjE